MGLKKGTGNSHRKKEVAALQCGALRLRCCGNGGNLLEWGGARESTVPFIIRYCRPEAVNDNDARARRGEAGQAGRDEPRRDWQGHRGKKCTVAVAVDVVDGVWNPGWTFDLLTLHPLTFDLWLGLGLDLRGAYLGAAGGHEMEEVSYSNFRTRTDSCHASTAVQQCNSPKRNMGLKILVLSGSVVTGRTGTWTGTCWGRRGWKRHT